MKDMVKIISRTFEVHNKTKGIFQQFIEKNMIKQETVLHQIINGSPIEIVHSR